MPRYKTLEEEQAAFQRSAPKPPGWRQLMTGAMRGALPLSAQAAMAYPRAFRQRFPGETPYALGGPGRLVGGVAADITGAREGLPFGQTPAGRFLTEQVTGRKAPPYSPTATAATNAGVPIPPARQTGVFQGGQPWKPGMAMTAFEGPPMRQEPVVTLPGGQQMSGEAAMTLRDVLRRQASERALAAGPETIGPAGASFAERTRQNAVRYGLEQPQPQTPEENVAYLTALYKRTRNTPEKRAIGEQLAAAKQELAAQAGQGRQMELGAQQGAVALGVAEAQARAKIGDVMFRQMMEVGKQEAAAGRTQDSAVGRAIVEAIKQGADPNDPEAIGAVAASVRAGFSGGGEQAQAQGAAMVDLNNNGIPDELDTDYNNLTRAMEENKDKWTPAQLLRATDQKKMLEERIKKTQRTRLV